MSEEVSGRAKGGLARAKKLTPEERSNIARQGGRARHKFPEGDSPILTATHGSDDHPLKVGDVEIPCYVLENGTRVLSQRGTMSGLNIARGSRRTGGGDQLVGFLRGKSIFPFVSKELMAVAENPIRFKHPSGGNMANGYPATILTDICEAILSARQAGALTKHYAHIADQCEILVRAFARVGIIALVDEATGYQRDRAKDALARILEQFIAKELQPYVPTFDTEFYQEMFRLRGLDYSSDSVRRPQYFGTLTNDVVYKRLAPGVLAELKKVTPKTESGRHKDKLFQRLTSNRGYPKLREHLGSVITLMTLSHDWHDFMQKLNIRHPKFENQLRLQFPYQPEKDDGKGI